MHVPASLSATFHLYFRPESFPVPEAIITIVCLYKATGGDEGVAGIIYDGILWQRQNRSFNAEI